MEERIKDMARKTWEAIQDDMNDLETVTSIQEAADCVMDANYMETYGQDKAAYEAWENMYNSNIDEATDIIIKALGQYFY